MAIIPLINFALIGAKDRGQARRLAGLANHRCIEIVRLLQEQPLLCVVEVALRCQVDQSTAVEHVRRLHEEGLVKKSEGCRVLLSTSKRSATLLRTADLLKKLHGINGIIAICPSIVTKLGDVVVALFWRRRWGGAFGFGGRHGAS